jgi:beta-lysine 5,6-aminomutase beta subunit
MSEKVKAYGDTLDDGLIQLCFTLPVEEGARGKEAACEFVRGLNCVDPKVVHMENTHGGFTSFVVYAKALSEVNPDELEVIEVESPSLDFKTINKLIKDKIGRKLIVLGANTGFDAHTVGIDAIFNMKGWKGDYGLERYPEIEALNMGAQVNPSELLEKAEELNADAILISKIVDQKDIHLKDLKELIRLAKEKGIDKKCLFIAGGPRITHAIAVELGYDAGFSGGTLPSDVASFIVHEYMKKKSK